MVNYREILRLDSLNYSQRQIAASVHSSRRTIKEVVDAASKAGIEWPLGDGLTNEILQKMFYPGLHAATCLRKEPDYSYIHKELAKSGVNLSLLWSEYCGECYSSGNTPYMYSQFCDKYRRWAMATKATMRIKHKPGEAMQVDWAGSTIPVHDPMTGEITAAYLFVAVLPCSCIVYAEACPDMKSDRWLSCHARAFSYYGGVPRLIIVDNLKTGVIKNTKYEVILNRSYQELAEHYDTAVVPARVNRPKDKSVAEGSVRYATTWIIAALRNIRFFSVEEVKAAVAEKLEDLNRYPFKQREGNRCNAYDEEEREYMKPLPLTPYEPAAWSSARVQLDYTVSDGKNKYSVPFSLIGEDVEVRLTEKIVEVFFNGSRVASHPRSAKQQRNPIVAPEHMPVEHKKYLSYNTDDFLSWAATVGGYTSKAVEFFLSSGKEPEQGFKSCASLTKLGSRYGRKRLEMACELALLYSKSPAVRNITAILKGGQDKPKTGGGAAGANDAGQFGITRGEAYFRKGGAPL
jgi:transposase